jgi:hypothetical protein
MLDGIFISAGLDVWSTECLAEYHIRLQRVLQLASSGLRTIS